MKIGFAWDWASATSSNGEHNLNLERARVDHNLVANWADEVSRRYGTVVVATGKRVNEDARRALEQAVRSRGGAYIEVPQNTRICGTCGTVGGGEPTCACGEMLGTMNAAKVALNRANFDFPKSDLADRVLEIRESAYSWSDQEGTLYLLRLTADGDLPSAVEGLCESWTSLTSSGALRAANVRECVRLLDARFDGEWKPFIVALLFCEGELGTLPDLIGVEHSVSVARIDGFTHAVSDHLLDGPGDWSEWREAIENKEVVQAIALGDGTATPGAIGICWTDAPYCSDPDYDPEEMTFRSAGAWARKIAKNHDTVASTGLPTDDLARRARRTLIYEVGLSGGKYIEVPLPRISPRKDAKAALDFPSIDATVLEEARLALPGFHSGDPAVSPGTFFRDTLEEEKRLHEAVDKWTGRGGGVCLVTISLPAMSLFKGHKELFAAWESMTRTAWQGGGHLVGFTRSFGLRHWVSRIDFTVSGDQFVPRLHILIFSDAPLGESSAALRRELRSKLAMHVRRVRVDGSLSLVTVQRGEELNLVDHLMWGPMAWLRGRTGPKRPFQLLFDDQKMWSIWESTMRGKRISSHSKGFRAALYSEQSSGYAQ